MLLYPSLEQGFDGFARDEADYAIENANINWKEHLIEKFGNSIDYETGCLTPASLPNDCLGDEEYFSKEEITYAIKHCGIDWNKAAASRVVYIVGEDIITRVQAVQTLQEEGFTKEQSEYGINEASIDWSQQASYYIEEVLIYQERFEYTNCPNCGDIVGVYEACPFCNEATNLCTDSSYTKSDVIEKLRYVGFTDAEIDKCLEDYDDSYFYNESDYKKP